MLEKFTPGLSLIRPDLRAEALECLWKRDVLGFLGKAAYGNDDWLDITLLNVKILQVLGIYERALLCAFTSPRVNNHKFSSSQLRALFGWCDRERLREAGDPLPTAGPFTVYRGVGGKGRARRVRGWSWTSSLEKARWFASRAEQFGFVDAAVYRAEIKEEVVLAYVNSRKEEEFVIDPLNLRPIRHGSQC